jgi:recombinational DNA repair ATPase RecF
MSVEQLEQTVLSLSPDERRRFLDWLYEHEQELRGPDYLHPEVKAEILRRREAALAHPEQLESWEGTTERARARLHEIRNQKAKGS